MNTDVAIVGIGNTPYGKLPEYDSTALGMWALKKALDDAALPGSAIDGLVVHRVGNYQKLAEMAGINPEFI